MVATLKSHRTGSLIAVDLQFFSMLPWLFFLAGVYQRLAARTNGSGLWGILAVAAGIAAGATVVACQSVLGVLVAYTLDGVPATVAKAMYAVYSGVYQASDIPMRSSCWQRA